MNAHHESPIFTQFVTWNADLGRYMPRYVSAEHPSPSPYGVWDNAKETFVSVPMVVTHAMEHAGKARDFTKSAAMCETCGVPAVMDGVCYSCGHQ